MVTHQAGVVATGCFRRGCFQWRAASTPMCPVRDSTYSVHQRLVSGNRSRCTRHESEKSREKARDGLRNRLYARTVILSVIGKDLSKQFATDMSRVPLIASERTVSDYDPRNMVILEAGLPGDTWRYCVERERLAEKLEWFQGLLMGPLAPAPSDPPPLVQLQHVEKRAFDHLLRYLHDEPMNFQSVSTARATLDAAHQYLCPGLARLAVDFLQRNLNSSTVLEIFQGLSLYSNDPVPAINRATAPTAPPAPGDDAGEIAATCTRLLLSCLSVIDTDPAAVLAQERFEELSANEIAELARRDSLRFFNESVLFEALERWAAAECRRRGVEPTPCNKRSALPDEVWYSVRYLLMSDREFVEGPMASGILSSEESAFIVARILGHHENCNHREQFRNTVSEPFSRLITTPRGGTGTCTEQSCRMSKSDKKERQDNRKNRRKECANQSQRTCARIGNCLIRVLACVFD